MIEWCFRVWKPDMNFQIYPSEFGKERMKTEQTQGPMELTSLPENPDSDTEEQRYVTELLV